MTTQTKNVPALRFPEFDGDWEENYLGKVTKFENGKAHENDIDENGKYIVVNSKFISSEGSVKKFSNKQISPLFKNDVVMVMSDIPKGKALAKCFYIDKDNLYTLNQRICALKPNGYINKFLFYIVNRNDYFLAFDSGVGQTNLKKDEILNCPLHIPSAKEEQQKIAAFLTVVDEKIQQITKKKDLLEQYKKGVMQQIFNQKIRFKDDNGNDFADWEEKKLGDVAKFSKGKGISKSDVSESGNLECIRYGQLYTHYKETITEVISRTNINESQLVLSEYNDVIIPASGETQLDIATASCVLKTGVALGGDLNIIKSKMNGVFLSYYLNNKKKLDIANLAQGISVVHLYPSQLATLRIDVPHIEEQNKLAKFISEIDKKINLVKQQIEKTQTFKKGLLQQMFV
ncbi:MAG: type restriction enzyme, subunit [Blastocatellia bacterium]|jgi:type I restriction enzyme S subunit|nr:type restriction enzyme, subunit [Blastocatellia bacterium]